jgi:DNA-binding beta-propeller fold protein YncE
MPSHLETDLYGRVYAPSAFHFSVEMLDSAGNRIARIGSYGNGDSAGPGSLVPQPEIAFAGPVACAFSERDSRLYVSDMANRRVVAIKCSYAAEAACAIP